jgi:hypothetical protein
MPDFKGPGQWRSQAVKAQGTAGATPAKKPAAKKTPPAKGKDKG